MKKCPTCGETKEDRFFYKDSRTTDGLKSQCRICHSVGNIKSRSKNPDKVRKDRRDFAKKDRERNPEKYRKREREASKNRAKDKKYYARQMVNIAVKGGLMEKPNVCLACKEIKKLTAHHFDYNKPLEVIWYCYQCHADVHRLGMGD